MTATSKALSFTIAVLAVALCGLALAGPKKPKDAITLGVPLASRTAGSAECSLGDLVADAVRDSSGAQFALIPAGELRNVTIPAGVASQAQIVQSLRYADDQSDQIVVLRVTGAQIQRAAERSLSRTPLPFDGFLQISGLRFRCDRSRTGGRTVTATATDGSAIVPAASYTVATTSAIADGSMGYYLAWKRADIVQATNVSISDALAKYLGARTALDKDLEDRILVNL